MDGVSRETKTDAEVAPGEGMEGVAEWLKGNGRSLGGEELKELKVYCQLLHKASAMINLISPADREKIAERHVLPALNMGPLLRAVPNRVVVDFGSGAGLPGIPLKIMFPESHFILIEARRKRANFLREVVRTIGLKKIEIWHCRIEELPRSQEALADVVVTRAASSLVGLWETVASVVQPHGAVIATLDSGRGIGSGAGVLLRKQSRLPGRTLWYGLVR